MLCLRQFSQTYPGMSLLHFSQRGVASEQAVGCSSERTHDFFFLRLPFVPSYDPIVRRWAAHIPPRREVASGSYVIRTCATSLVSRSTAFGGA